MQVRSAVSVKVTQGHVSDSHGIHENQAGPDLVLRSIMSMFDYAINRFHQLILGRLAFRFFSWTDASKALLFGPDAPGAGGP